MARIRTIKPEFWTSEQVVECSTTARLLFIGLWNFCDDAGIHPASPMRIKMQLFPADETTVADVESLLGELVDAGLLVSYEAEGKSYYQVTGWHHQKIDKPNFRYPSPNGSRIAVEDSASGHPRNRKVREGSLRSTVDLGDDQKFGVTGEKLLLVRDRANKVATAVGKRATSKQDRSLVAKAAILSLHSPFNEQWLFSAAEGVKRSKGKKDRPYAYLHKCLGEGAAKLGRNFNTCLARVEVPESLMHPPPTDSLSDRLCDEPSP
jgi:hypothetical protein